MKATKSLFGILTIAAALAGQVHAQGWLMKLRPRCLLPLLHMLVEEKVGERTLILALASKPWSTPPLSACATTLGFRPFSAILLP